MPIYRYQCQHCKKRFEIFLSYNEYGVKPVNCPHCASDQVLRRVERVRVARSEESRMDALTDPSGLEGLEDDPRAMGKMMRKMSNEMGEDVGPEFNEVVGRLEAGENPEEIEKSMPDLEGGMGGTGGMGDDLDY